MKTYAVLGLEIVNVHKLFLVLLVQFKQLIIIRREKKMRKKWEVEENFKSIHEQTTTLKGVQWIDAFSWERHERGIAEPLLIKWWFVHWFVPVNACLVMLWIMIIMIRPLKCLMVYTCMCEFVHGTGAFYYYLLCALNCEHDWMNVTANILHKKRQTFNTSNPYRTKRSKMNLTASSGSAVAPMLKIKSLPFHRPIGAFAERVMGKKWVSA